MTSLANSRVLVIGASSGIGLAVAEAAIAAGAAVTIAWRSSSKLDEALKSLGTQARSAVLDTANEKALEGFFSANDPFDHIVVSAAQTPTGPVRKLALADAEQAMESKF
ncbi:SDR family NAD(P)-dependent oxidoreductase [Rhizobium phaseoli]|uniref:SDR family NAD(P)-dependent oxidoreductase n=1 Tax=Rhizobium phaseoli TaxID=396 RepID=UPI001CEDED0A|nr:SDR family NAD(P)-dependent oxidoreductase [Rhizobium phaseoli]MDK4725480.1 SDR family NAD(P)-dependent oxidoreductase [Rhizobium phaseoli]